MHRKAPRGDEYRSKIVIIGYARVSTDDQSDALQRDALTKAGVERVYSDTISGGTSSRPQLDLCLDHLREGDVLVVWRLDRLGRSLGHLIQLMGTLAERKVGLRSLTESIDTTTPGGRLVYHIFGAIAEFERDLIRERTRAGLAAARARGRKGGRPPKLAAAEARRARQLHAQGNMTAAEICRLLGIGRTTLYRYLEADKWASSPAT